MQQSRSYDYMGCGKGCIYQDGGASAAGSSGAAAGGDFNRMTPDDQVKNGAAADAPVSAELRMRF